MKYLNYKLILKYSIVIIWMIIIFKLSSEVSIESSSRSYILLDAIQSIDNQLFAWLNEHIIRKSAHVFMFLILGILVYNVIKDCKLTAKKAIFFSILISLFYAISDEIHQTFVPGRSGEVGDVLIDTTASAIGVGVYYLIHKLHTKRKISKTVDVKVDKISEKNNEI